MPHFFVLPSLVVQFSRTNLPEMLFISRPLFRRLDHYITSLSVCQEVFQKFFIFFFRSRLTYVAAPFGLPCGQLIYSTTSVPLCQYFCAIFFLFVHFLYLRPSSPLLLLCVLSVLFAKFKYLTKTYLFYCCFLI